MLESVAYEPIYAQQGVPGAESAVPALSIHLPPAGEATGAAVIIAPGGGYRSLASDHEGLQVARWFNGIGVAAFVLRYRLGPEYHSRVSLLDGLRAVRYVRNSSKKFRINPQHIGFMGFSAGGHLACAVATGSDTGSPGAADPVERCSSGPNFVVGVYAVTNGAVRGRKADEYTPVDTQVTPDTPPMFLMHTHEDRVVPASQSTLLYNALLAAGVPAELHIFNHGDHAVGLAVGDSDVGSWPELLQRWLRRRKFLTQKPRCAVVGCLLVDGKPLGKAWLALEPRDPCAPLARTFLTAASDGKFMISVDEGPVAGTHLLKVLEVSARDYYDSSGVFSLAGAMHFECEREVVAGEEIVLNLRKDQFLLGKH